VRKGILFAAATFFAWSCGDALTKFLTQDHSILTIALIEALTGSVVLLAAAPLLGGIGGLRTRHPWLHLARSACLGVQFVLFIYAYSRIPLATAYTLIFAAPLIAALLARPLLGDRLDKPAGIALAAGFLGVLVALRPGFVPLSLPVLAGLASAVLFAGSAICTRMMGPEEPALALGFYPTFGVFLGAAILAAIQGYTPPSFGYGGLMALSGCISSTGLVLLGEALRFAPVTRVMPMHYTQLVWGSLAGLLFFGDLPDAWTYAGAALIMASGAWLLVRGEGTPPHPRPPPEPTAR
jgi:S-adenosylmethionine uptake transporter